MTRTTHMPGPKATRIYKNDGGGVIKVSNRDQETYWQWWNWSDSAVKYDCRSEADKLQMQMKLRKRDVDLSASMRRGYIVLTAIAKATGEA